MASAAASAESSPVLSLSQRLSLHGRTALVTGGFGGLGRHFAEVLLAHGARVALAGRRIALGQAVAAELAAACGRPDAVRAYAMDVTDAASVNAVFAAVAGELGMPTVVVNNAGTIARGPSETLSDADWQSVVDVNLSGVFRVARAAGLQMISAGSGGSIVNIASILGLRVRTQALPYAATKAAVVQLTQALALEWAPHGIRVNALAPGYFESDINREYLHSAAGQALVQRVPLQRTGHMHELDGPLMLLASDAGAFMTGAIIPVDGGHLVSTL